MSHSLRRAVAALLALALALAATACKSAEEKACANALEIIEHEMPEGIDMPDRFASVDTCVEAMDKDLNECNDREAVLDCMADVDTMKALLACRDHCD